MHLLGPISENNCETSALVLCVPEVPILGLTLETGQIYLQNSWVSSVSLGRRSVGDINMPRLFIFKHLQSVADNNRMTSHSAVQKRCSWKNVAQLSRLDGNKILGLYSEGSYQFD